MQVVVDLESRPAVITVSGDLAHDDVPRLESWFEVFLGQSGSMSVVCDVARLETTDLVAMDAIARLRLSARRRRCAFVVRGAPPRLAELADFLGLSEVLATERS